jgi:hypothetical protein
MTHNEAVDYVKTHVFVHHDLITGKELTWYQENESAILTKAEAIEVLQRTVDFWLVKLRDIFLIAKLPLETARAKAITSFRNKTISMLAQNTENVDYFPVRFGVTIDDLRFNC